MSSTIIDQINDAKETLSAAKEAACSHGCTPRNGALALTDGEFNIKYREFRFATAPFSATAQPVWKAVQAATDDLASLIRDKQAIDSAAALAAAMQLTATLTAQVSSLAGLSRERFFWRPRGASETLNPFPPPPYVNPSPSALHYLTSNQRRGVPGDER